MPNYAWICYTCKAVNDPSDIACRTCGFPAEATGKQIEEAVTGIKQPPSQSSKELRRQRQAELAALPAWKKPLAYFLYAVQFFAALILWAGIFNLTMSLVLIGIASLTVAEVLYQLLKGKTGDQQTAAPQLPPVVRR
ncbi:MAG: hypothetical protein LBV49_05470 [Azonexus sp.]|jgi:Flp pilus assembly protein TadB|nr:hypothetical protein [Azonexus sp.]